MNAKLNEIKSNMLVGTGAIALLVSAFVLDPTQPKQQVVTAPFVIDEISESNAVVHTANHEFTLEIKFDARYFKDGNGYESGRDAELNQIKEITVFNEDGQTENYYLDQSDVSILANQLESELRDRL